jgi:hypothetical protein
MRSTGSNRRVVKGSRRLEEWEPARSPSCDDVFACEALCFGGSDEAEPVSAVDSKLGE